MLVVLLIVHAAFAAVTGYSLFAFEWEHVRNWTTYEALLTWLHVAPVLISIARRRD